MIILSVSLLLLAYVSASSTTTGSHIACQNLQTGTLKPIVATSGSLYDEGATSAWNLLNANLRPDCIVFPRTTQDVSIAMEAIFKFKARYAVQAGGHSAMLGWNNAQGGVLIHFQDMKGISYDAKSGTVTFEPGLRWGEALDAVEPHGVAVAGGRVSDVGTGLLLGGGLSFLAPQVGYSADTMREVDVVLVNGTIVTATATNAHSDLFRALKGGTNRFGIVTRYVVDAIPTGTKTDKRWFGGNIVYSNSSVDALLTALSHYALNVNDPKSNLLMNFVNIFGNDTITPLIQLTAFHEGTSLPESVFGEFLSIPAIQSNFSSLSYYDVANLVSGGQPGVTQVQRFTGSVLEGSNDIQLYRETYALYADLCENFKGELGVANLAFTPVQNSQIAVGRAKGGNAIDAPRGGFHEILLSMTMPEGVQNTSPRLEKARQEFAQKAPNTPGLPLYLAESDMKQQAFQTYGGYEFLKKTYRIYDPTRFNVQFTDGPPGL